MPESAETIRQRFMFNCFPCFAATGAKVTYIAADYREVRVTLALNWLTRNYVGTIFGGSMFAATDPLYMIMLIKILGKDFIVWDKGASIKFLKPGKTRLHANFRISDADLQAIEETMATAHKMERTFNVSLVDDEGTPHATVDRLIYIRRKPGANQPSREQSGD